MKKLGLLGTIIGVWLGLCMSLRAGERHLLPTPKSVTLLAGDSLRLSGAVRLAAPLSPRLEGALSRYWQVKPTASMQAPLLHIELGIPVEGAYDYPLAGYENEAYGLEVSGQTIHIQAPTELGALRAIQTLAQWALPEGKMAPCSIRDWPAFKLRGFMHDVGRSFISLDALKRQIWLLSHFKVNTFHWHLTENQAWRFEVKAFPQLTAAAYCTRFPGQYYTQAQCRELDQWAYDCGVTLIPEIDMPGHSAVFERAMGYDMQSDKGMAALKTILDEVAATFPHAPYLHIGADEKTITRADFLPTMLEAVHRKGKKVVVWNPIRGVDIAHLPVDMTQMWSTGGRLIPGKANIDCRYNYTNHFDVFADLVGIYKSQIYYADQGNADIAGEISAAWNDRKLANEEQIMGQNSVYANVIASAVRAWKGGGKQYIEQGGVTLPNCGEEYEDFKDFETRFLYHKSHLLREEAIPYVRQTHIRWRITDPFPNQGKAEAVFPPEREEPALSYEWQGQTYQTHLATGAGIYLRHTWGDIVPAFFAQPALQQTAYAYTYVYVPRAQTVGIQVEMHNYGRSECDAAPPQGKWDGKGSRIWVNDQEILPPHWLNGSGRKTHEDLLQNENFTARPPLRCRLQQGWNKVLLKLPYVAHPQVRLNKWMFTCFFTTPDGRDEPQGLVYSPTRTMEGAREVLADRVARLRQLFRQKSGKEPGDYDVVVAQQSEAFLTAIEATLATTLPAVTRRNQGEQLDSLEQHFLASRVMPTLSQPGHAVAYYLSTPLRHQRYLTARGVGQALVGEAAPSAAAQWWFEKGPSGSYLLRNAADGSYLSPEAPYNQALRTVAAAPSQGWRLLPAATEGLFILQSGTCQLNQTQAGLGWQVYNWGGGKNTTDGGCQLLIREAKTSPQPSDSVVSREFSMTTGHFTASNSWGNYHKDWASTATQPQLFVETAANDMWHIEGQDAPNCLHLFTRKFTLRTDPAFRIVGYAFAFKGYAGNNSSSSVRRTVSVRTEDGQTFQALATQPLPAQVKVSGLCAPSTYFEVESKDAPANIVPENFVVWLRSVQDDVTAIHEVQKALPVQRYCFDMKGQPVQVPQRGQLYIINGQKCIY